MPSTNTNKKSKAYLGVSITITILALVVAVIHVFMPRVDSLRLDGTLVGILVVAAIPWLIDRIEVLKGPGFEIRQG